MTEPQPSRSDRLRVCMIHDYRESQQISMKLYAERLGSALEQQGVAVQRIRLSSVLPDAWRSFWLGNKLDSYAGRFIAYPYVVRAAGTPDLYHIVDHGQAHLLAGLDSRRTVVTCHDLMLLVLESGRLGRKSLSPVALQVFRIVSRLLNVAAAVIAVSHQTRLDLIKFAGVDPDRIEVIPSGLNQHFTPDPRVRASGRRRWGLDGQKVVLQVGNAFYKNVENCLRVVAQLKRRGIAVTFLRGGRALSSTQRACARKLGIEAQIRDLGPLPDNDLPVLYNVADVLLCPSLYEGFGWPPLEAMASGTPVVCSRAGSLAEIASPAALTADPEDVERLTEHVAVVLSQPEVAAHLRRRGLEYAAGFDWKLTAHKVEHLYRRVRERA